MFDSSFDRSELYFTILQLLREFEEWIRESNTEMQELQKRCMERITVIAGFPRTSPHHDCFEEDEDPVRAIEIKRLEENWTQTLSHLKSTSKSLYERLEKKSTEVKSLRDGVSGRVCQDFPSIAFCWLTSTAACCSFSMRLQYSKPQGAPPSISISLFSLL